MSWPKSKYDMMFLCVDRDSCVGLRILVRRRVRIKGERTWQLTHDGLLSLFLSSLAAKQMDRF